MKSKKVNKLNLSSDNIETNMNTYSFIESGPTIEDDQDDDEIDLPKLNFTCILNNPLEDTSYTSLFGQLILKFQEDQRIVTEEERIKKEGYKFDLIDIIQDNNSHLKHNNSFSLEDKMTKKIKKDKEEEEEELDDILNDLEQLENIFSVKKNLEQCIKETNEELFKNKKTFKLKKYVDLPYNNYIAKIKHEYLIYRDFHKKNIMKKIILEDLNNNDNLKIGNKEEIMNTVNNYRKSLIQSMNLIEKEYIIDTNNYKIKDNLLNMDINQIMESTMKMIEQKGIVELESEKSKVNYNLIKYFFRNNYPKLINEVNDVYSKITTLIDKKNFFKKNFLDITRKLIMKKLKRQNLLKLNYMCKKMLGANCHNIEDMKEIIEIREMREKVKNIPNIELNIIQKIKEELDNRETNKNLDNIYKISTLIKNEINNCFEVETYIYSNEEEEEHEDDDDEENPKKKYNYKYYNLEENIFKKIFQYKNIKEIIFLIINPIDENFINEKYYSFLELAQNKDEYIQKVINVLLSSVEQVLLTTFGKILPLKNLNEMLFLFYIGKMSQYLFDSINKMFNEKDKDKIMIDVNNTLFNIIDKNLFFIIDDLSNYNQNIDQFIIKNKLLKEVYNQIPIFLLNKKFSEKIENYELSFIEYFGKGRNEKMKNGLTCDNLRNLDSFSNEYQELINIIFSFSNEFINRDEEKKIEDLKNNILLDVDLSKIKKESKEINLIEIPKISEGKKETKNCKLMSTSLDLIDDSIYTLKMILFFNKKFYNEIFSYLYDIFYNFINLNNDIVLETKGQIKNITQNELAASYSSVYLIREITSKIISFLNSSNDINEETKKKYNDLETSSKEYLENNILKLKDMIQSGINESSLDEFKKIITSEKYPIINKGSLPINPFAESLVKVVKNVSKSLKNCYEDKTISKIILDILNNFNNEVEKLLEKKELNDEEEKKQFKKDFLFIKKNIDNGIDDIDFKGFKKKLTTVYKKLLPKEKGE